MIGYEETKALGTDKTLHDSELTAIRRMVLVGRKRSEGILAKAAPLVKTTHHPPKFLSNVWAWALEKGGAESTPPTPSKTNNPHIFRPPLPPLLK